jgi:hypothetical protein
MKKSISLLIVSALFLFLNIYVLASSVEVLENDGQLRINDLGMPIADLSEPFTLMTVHGGRCIADGVISDLKIDLDGDGLFERLIIYIAESIYPSFTRDQDKNIVKVYDLHMAVFKENNGAYNKYADIIISESQLVMQFADIHISIWGNEKKYIYLYSAVQQMEGIGIRHSVFTFFDGKLNSDLALIDPGFTDDAGLYRIFVRDSANLHKTNYSEGYIIYKSLPDIFPITESFIRDYYDARLYWEDKDTQHKRTSEFLRYHEVYDWWYDEYDEEDEYTSIDNLNDSIWSQYSCHPSRHRYKKELIQELAPFGITLENTINTEICIPICTIRYIKDFLNNCYGGQIVDYTGIAR